MRPLNLEDELWLKTEFGEELQKVFSEVRIKEICRIAYRLLENKEAFSKQKVTVVNEEGETAEVEIGGVKLFYSLVSGMDEKLEIVKALLATIGISRPMQDKMIADEMEEQKKNLEMRLTGEKSSTSSAPNTDGPAITSGL